MTTIAHHVSFINLPAHDFICGSVEILIYLPISRQNYLHHIDRRHQRR